VGPRDQLRRLPPPKRPRGPVATASTTTRESRKRGSSSCQAHKRVLRDIFRPSLHFSQLRRGASRLIESEEKLGSATVGNRRRRSPSGLGCDLGGKHSCHASRLVEGDSRKEGRFRRPQFLVIVVSPPYAEDKVARRICAGTNFTRSLTITPLTCRSHPIGVWLRRTEVWLCTAMAPPCEFRTTRRG
jgi:hypothetical protein